MADNDQPVDSANVDVVSTSSQAAQSRRPSRVKYFLALIAVMAVLLAYTGPWQVSVASMPRFTAFARDVIRVTHEICTPAAITIVLFELVLYRKGYWCFDQPGHWLLVEIALHQTLYLLPLIINHLWSMSVGDQGGVLISPSHTLQAAIVEPTVSALNLYIGCQKCNDPNWQRVFFAKAVTIVPVLGDLLVLVFGFRAVRSDRRISDLVDQLDQGKIKPRFDTTARPLRKRDLAHWYGVIIQFVLSGLVIIPLCAILVWLCSRLLP